MKKYKIEDNDDEQESLPDVGLLGMLMIFLYKSHMNRSTRKALVWPLRNVPTKINIVVSA